MGQKQVSRRNFLKLTAGAGAAVGLGSTLRHVALEPFVQPPESELPGRATWYASTCRQCPAGCGIIVRVVNGRPRKIEGNPAHPLNRGKLCARGQAGLQQLYNPDRLQNAVRQNNGRGSREFEPMAWDVALDQLTSSFGRLSNPEALGFLGGLLPDHLYSLVSKFLDAAGAPPPVLFDLHSALDGRASAADLSSRWFGADQLPIYDIANAEVVFSFGSNFLETWMSPVAQSFDYGSMRQGQLGGRGFLLQFEPRMSSTAASADEWMPVEPGTEGLIALGLGRIIVEEDLGRAGSHRDHSLMYRNVDVGAVAEASGVPSDELLRLARIYTDVDRPVAIPGGYLSSLPNGQPASDAVMALNVIMRRLGRDGGVFLPQNVPAEAFSSTVPASDFSDVEQLIDRMQAGEVELMLIHSSNPIYDLPSWSGFKEALSNVPTVISFSPFVDETAAASDWVLPDHTYLEGWGYQVVAPGADRPTVSGQQPVTIPIYDTRSTADVFLALAESLGGDVAAALPWKNEMSFLEENAAQLLGSSIGIYDAPTPAGFWSRWRQNGGWWSENTIRQEPVSSRNLTQPLEVPQAEFNGDPEDFPFYLVPYEAILLSDGRGANQPWLQETPDPMTTARWNTWVELNPETATRLGLHDNDLVRVSSSTGELTAPVVVFPGIRPDAVAIPTGQGHQDYGRYAERRGANVMELVAPSDGSLQWGSTRVRLDPVGRTAHLARLENLDGEGRETIR